ncbi:MAG: hypothetical protein AAGA58_18340 [Verrucomicrobiota bacterium]
MNAITTTGGPSTLCSGPIGRIIGLLGAVTISAAALNSNAVTDFQVLETSPEYEEAALDLRSQTRKPYEFSRALLNDVLRFLADDAGISYISLPETEATSSALITFNINASPFVALETIARTNGVALVYEDGIFHMRPIDDNQLIGRTYSIRFNTGETASEDGTLGFGSSVGGGGLGTAGASSGAASGGSNTGGSGLSSGGTIGGSGNTLTTNGDRLVEDIRSLIGIATTGFDANIAGDASVGNFAPLTVNTDGTVVANNDAASAAIGLDSSGTSGGGTVIWNSDTNTLFVVATRQQHQWVEAYLEAVDKPQPLIAIEIKFFETTKDPSRQLGIDWSGLMDGGVNVGLSGPGGIGSPLTRGVEYETFRDLLDINQFQDFVSPQTAVLSADALQLSVDALVKDRETETVSYPRVLARNNRPVQIQSVVEQPVLAASSSTTPGVGATSTASVEYIPIGTQIAVKPKIMDEGRIMLTVVIEISSIIGSEIIDGNPYPVTSSRVFTAPMEVETGYTLAIGGLDEASDSTEGAGLPLVSKAPVLKRLFGTRTQSFSSKNLMIFITPTVLDTRSGGLSKEPVSTVPLKGPDSLVNLPRVHTDGSLIGGLDGVNQAIAWLQQEYEYVDTLVEEKRAKPETREHLNNLIHTTEVLQQQVAQMKAEHPDQLEEIEVYLTTLRDVESKYRETRWEMRRRNYKLFSAIENNAEPF